MIHLHTAYYGLGIGLQAMFFVNLIHNPVAEVIWYDDNDDLFLCLEGDAVIRFQRFHAAPSGPENGAASGSERSGCIKHGFRVSLIDADEDQAVSVF